MDGRLIAIGDIHGHAKALTAILSGFSNPEDTL